ncbi:MAG: hypothetical protein ACPGJS_15885 [Flammeovirgaceae bacterium]
MLTLNKFIRYTFLLIVLTGCTLDNLLHKLDSHRTVTIQPAPLAYHADSITFDVIIEFPNHVSLKSGAEYTLSFSYHTNQGDSLFLGNIFVEDALTGKNRSITKQLGLPYREKYNTGEVLVKSSLTQGKQSLEGTLVKVADGIINTHQLKQPAYYIHFLPHNHQYQVEHEEKSLHVYFDNNQSEYTPTIKASSALQQLEDYIAKNELHDEIQIVGYHSPIRTEASTSILAKQRADETANYIQQLYQQYEHTTIPQMTSRAIFQDWGLFSRVLQESQQLSKAEKEEILAQIDGGVTYLDMDNRFKKLKSYPVLKNYIYPLLRQSTIIISVPKVAFTEAEIVVWAKKIVEGTAPIDTLAVSELALAAAKSPSLKEKQAIYETALRHYQNEPVFHNNLACVYLQLANKQSKPLEREKFIEKAIIQLKKGLQLPEPMPEFSINLAAAQILKGNTPAALKRIISLPNELDASLTQSVHAMKGYIYLDRGDYVSAIKSFTEGGEHPTVLYDKALAYLLYASKNNLTNIYVKAQEAFDKAIEADAKNVWAHYGAAVTAARQKDERLLTKHLSNAFKLNPKLQEKANKDLEFINFRTKDSFKAAFEQ